MAQSDVDEALRLMQMSKFSLYSDDRQKSGLDAISDIYSILRDEAARTNKMDVSYAHALNWISRKVSYNSYSCCLHFGNPRIFSVQLDAFVRLTYKRKYFCSVIYK